MHLSSHLQGRLRLLAVGALVVSALAAGPALARGKKVTGTGSEQCYVTPNPVSNDAIGYYTVVGSGFVPYQTVEIFVTGSGTQAFFAVADAYGNFATQRPASLLGMDGQWTVSVSNGVGIVATCYLTVT